VSFADDIAFVSSFKERESEALEILVLVPC